jgi:vesicle coat complex subunit
MSPADALDADIQSFGRPDLNTVQGCHAHRSRVLLAIVTRLQLLAKFGARDALALCTRITVHLYSLNALYVLTEVELDIALADLRRAYERDQPELVELLFGLED